MFVYSGRIVLVSYLYLHRASGFNCIPIHLSRQHLYTLYAIVCHTFDCFISELWSRLVLL